MTASGEVLARLRSALAAFDEDALVALATKGLLKRARRDLETQTPEIAGENAGRVVVRIEGETVELAPSPRDSICSCPSDEICRHVVAAIVFVKSGEPATSVETAPVAPSRAASLVPELLAIGDDALEAHGGKAIFKRASRSLARGLEVELDDAVPLVVRFPGLNVSVRFLPGSGGGLLEGSLCSCRASACEHRVEAVLGVQVSRGARPPLVDDAALEASSGAPRSRDEVRLSVKRFLIEMVATGLSRLSRAAAGRMTTLAMSAHGVDLPRLSRLLDTLAHEVDAQLSRKVSAGTPGLLTAASRTLLLAEALARPVPALVGEHRSPYLPVGELVLHGLGARRFVTPSGFIGLRSYFWDESSRRFAAWTDARPEGTPGFDPIPRFRAPGPWTGCPSPEVATRSRFRLGGAQRNARGRLSGREASTFTALEPSQPLALPVAVHDFSALVERAYTLFGGFLRDRRELADLVVLGIASAGPATFDAVRQRLSRPVSDAAGRTLRLVVRHEEQTAELVDALEEKGDLSGVLGQLRLDDGQLVVEPLALYQGAVTRSPTLEPPRVKPRRATLGQRLAALAPSPAPVAPDTEADDADEPVEIGASGSRIGRTLSELEGALESLAEGGLLSGTGAGPVAEVTTKLERLGLSSVAIECRGLLGALETLRRSSQREALVDDAAERLLRSYHVARVASEVETVRVACEALA
ncbi:MAG: hypothetical protein JNK60_20175 [Acidobacteria bacterium]|nr:hypothetical protein [Acidobacteriota bacterium]